MRVLFRMLRVHRLIIRRLVPFLTCAVVLCACSSPPGSLRADVEAYLLRVNDWAPGEAETARTIDRILATQFVDEPEVRRQIAADGPRAQRQLERLRAYEPRTPVVRDLHQRYVAAWTSLLAGYSAIQNGLDAGDPARLAEGRRALERWRATIVSTASALRQLIATSGASVRAPPTR